MDWVQFGIMFGTLIGVLITAYALFATLKNFKKQLQLNFFSDYTKRYQEVMLNFPYEINNDDFDYSVLDKETHDKTLKYMRVYFDLCSEEYYLWKNKHIENASWTEWRDGIKNTFSKVAFRKGWELVTFSTSYYPDFTKLVDDILAELDEIK